MYNCRGIDANRERHCDKILILLVTTKLLFLLDYLIQIHILLRFRDEKRGTEAQKYKFWFIYEGPKFGFRAQF